MARENPRWDCVRVCGELHKLGIRVGATTIRTLLRRHGLGPAPRRCGPTWAQFLKAQAEGIVACDFLTVETGPLLVKRLDVVRRFFLFRFGIVHRDRLTPEIKRAYLAPNPTAASRTGVLIFLREIPIDPSDPVSHFWGELEDGLERHFRDKPVGIAWGMKDAAFTPAVLDELWLGTFPHAVVTRVPDAGHFVQEDAYERVVPALLELLGGDDPRSGAPATGSARLPGHDPNVEVRGLGR